MEEFYIIGKIKPLKKIDLLKIDSLVYFTLPSDYKEFLFTYGLGNITELIIMFYPDENYVKSNFGEYMDIWDLTDEEIQLTLNSLTIATTIDGDIISIVDDREKPFVILPRHSEKLISFESFEKLIEYYDITYDLKGELYFDSNYNCEFEYIDLVKNNFLDQSLLDIVLQNFLLKFPVDKCYNFDAQPKYIIQKIGGWIYFDKIYKSSIRAKYQKQFKHEADKIISMIKSQL
ncbi:SMI1/KNR4 family protein [Flavobacterium tyrosinilyticum]|uniref:SMI1/KNR4 family protein n=1 Tax=Flavobacterium tyrosinilyticum TaxID=1658740 RepID=UPI002030D38C|nr:hypothetical protein [Flavobacterium tyrosinilyticum]MCM0667464.1 hypothetical protein [Flavobacterium tyrosinilyticum]